MRRKTLADAGAEAAPLDPKATEIQTADLDASETHLCITWADGHESVLPLKMVRAQCPCATCRELRAGGAAAASEPADPFRVLDTRNAGLTAVMVDVEQMGTYAMRITWEDGHTSGIYTFEYLRDLCPCPACNPVATGS